MVLPNLLAMFSSPSIHPPQDAYSNIFMIYRWIHFLAGITWIGLLYFFNLVNVPFMKEIDAATKGKVIPSLMPRALWWFRWGAVITVLAGLAYWMKIVSTDASNGGGSAGPVIGYFFLIWTVVFLCIYICIVVIKIKTARARSRRNRRRPTRPCR